MDFNAFSVAMRAHLYNCKQFKDGIDGMLSCQLDLVQLVTGIEGVLISLIHLYICPSLANVCQDQVKSHLTHANSSYPPLLEVFNTSRASMAVGSEVRACAMAGASQRASIRDIANHLRGLQVLPGAHSAMRELNVGLCNALFAGVSAQRSPSYRPQPVFPRLMTFQHRQHKMTGETCFKCS